MIDSVKRAVYPQYVTEEDKTNYQDLKANPDQFKNQNPYRNFYDADPPNVSDIVDTASLDDIVDFDSNIDTFIDTLGSSKASGGLFRWAKKTNSAEGKAELFYDSNELGAIAPALAKGYYSSGSYEGLYFEDDNDLWVEGDLKPEDQRSMYYYSVDHDAMSVLSFMAHKRARQRLDTLTASCTRSGMLAILGIVEYTNETAAANSGLGQGEVYWDISLDRMRAVT
jgi:hypothetical protein